MREAILLVKLIRSSLQQRPESYSKDEFDSEALETLVRDQNLVSFLYPILSKQKEEVWVEIAKNLENDYNDELHRALVQGIEMQALLDKLEKRKMDCLPLKGYVMKEYYFEPTFRSMTDFDVLLRDFDTKEVQSWMESMGYSAKRLGDDHHDVYVKKPYMVAELHKNLSDEKVEREVPQIDEWLEKVWERCILADGKQHTYEMTEEDFYIYHVIHLYKHVRLGGISIRPLIDTHVFMEKKREHLNWKYLDDVFEELQLKKFECVMRELSQKCFEKEDLNLSEEEQRLLLFFIENGMFGDAKTKATTAVLTGGDASYTKGRLAMYLRTLFQPARVLEGRYPILKKYPFVLPFIWVVRAFRVAFRERHKITLLQEASGKEECDKMQELFQIAGIVEK